MVSVESYRVAVSLCVVTMVCWGSWANTQKLAGKAWPFQLFYWDYSIGVVLLALLFAFTLGSMGTGDVDSFLTLHSGRQVAWIGIPWRRDSSMCPTFYWLQPSM